MHTYGTTAFFHQQVSSVGKDRWSITVGFCNLSSGKHTPEDQFSICQYPLTFNHTSMQSCKLFRLKQISGRLMPYCSGFVYSSGCYPRLHYLPHSTSWINQKWHQSCTRVIWLGPTDCSIDWTSFMAESASSCLRRSMGILEQSLRGTFIAATFLLIHSEPRSWRLCKGRGHSARYSPHENRPTTLGWPIISADSTGILPLCATNITNAASRSTASPSNKFITSHSHLEQHDTYWWINMPLILQAANDGMPVIDLILPSLGELF